MTANELKINITCYSDNEESEEIFYDENEDFDYLSTPMNCDLHNLFEDIQRQHHISQKRINAFKRRYEKYCLRNNIPYNENSELYIKSFRRYYGLNPERKSSDTIKRSTCRSSMRKLRRLIEDYESSFDYEEKERPSKISLEKQASWVSIFQCFCFKVRAKRTVDEFEELLTDDSSHGGNETHQMMEMSHLNASRSNSKQNISSRRNSKQSIISQGLRASISFHTRSWQNKIDNILNNDYTNELKTKLRLKKEKRLSLQFSLSSADDNFGKDLKRRSTDPCLVKYEKLTRT